MRTSDSSAAARQARAACAAAADRIAAMQEPGAALPMGGDGKGAATRLVPYFANLGAFGLVVAAAAAGASASDARRWRVAARRWAEWYDARRNPDGTLYDFERTAPGGGSAPWKPTGKYDSTDSYASTYLELVDALHRGGPDRAWLRGRYPFVRRSVDAMRLTLQKNDLTTATPTWPVMYTMDNVEVLRGLRAAVRLARAQGAASDARAWAAMADRTQAAIARHLWDEKNGWYRVGVQTDGGIMAGGLAKWYPDVMANLMAIGWFPEEAAATRPFYARHRDLYERIVARTEDAAGSGIPARDAALPDDERLGRLAWWGFAARAMGDRPRLAAVRGHLVHALSGPGAGRRAYDNPATLGHACRLLAGERAG
ncbi:MAG TPA: hypothetical protein VM490_23785 [Armatimonadaceae bacterium]|nr:hypothetical protein [Armatimonadaceae bacterium]